MTEYVESYCRASCCRPLWQLSCLRWDDALADRNLALNVISLAGEQHLPYGVRVRDAARQTRSGEAIMRDHVASRYSRWSKRERHARGAALCASSAAVPPNIWRIAHK